MSTISRKLHIQHTAAAGLCSAKEVKKIDQGATQCTANSTVSANAVQTRQSVPMQITTLFKK
jgi:hypothetical protein